MVESQEKKSNPRSVTGLVVSNSMDKTITVQVERRVKHPIYGKFVRRSTKLHAHDQHNECNVGDKVILVETRPISKSKTWQLLSIESKVSEADKVEVATGIDEQ